MRPLDVAMTCPAGFEDVVAEAASVELRGFAASLRSSGFVRAQTVAPVGQLRAFSPATNVFALVGEAPRSNVGREARGFADQLARTPRPATLPRKGSLRLRIHSDGQFDSTNSAAPAALEQALSEWSQLRVSRRSANLEIWLIRRAELSSSFLGTKISEGSRKPERGELRSEICAALARLEPLNGATLVIDPFAGSGAIGEACLRAGAERVWLNDIDPAKPSKSSLTNTRWTRSDFRTLEVQPGSVSAIVTDPPWGQFNDVDEGIESLYSDIGAAAGTWLRPGGAIVLLSGAGQSAIDALLERGELRLERELSVLVNGRQATVITARKPMR